MVLKIKMQKGKHTLCTPLHNLYLWSLWHGHNGTFQGGRKKDGEPFVNKADATNALP